jgi:oxygen-independent coproporphyrinogen-3 oxidase
MPARLLPTRERPLLDPQGGDKKGLNIVSDETRPNGDDAFAVIADNPLAGAFARKVAVHAGMGGERVDESELPALLERLHETPRRGPAAAYVHLPYCESKCLYCGFFGGKYSPEAGAAYVEALIGEVEREARYPSTISSPINALYLGGGTPTALRGTELRRLLRALRAVLPLANDCEITVEGRVHNFDAERIEACLEGGANRFSIGIQSFDTRIRQGIGRFTAKEEVCRLLEHLAAYNQAAVIIDLIYGLPGQSVEHWEEDIRTFLSLPLDGVDLYQLNIFPGSALAKGIAAGSLPETASLVEQGRFFERGLALMQEARCRRLSLSHWGRTSRERNLYNPLAKGRADCLHYGAGAGGSLHGWFMFNESKVESYLRRCNSAEKPVVMAAAPPEDLNVLRLILEQMEHCRLNLDDLDALFAEDPRRGGLDARTLYAPLLDNWQEAGLISRDGPWVELSTAGQFWQVNLAQALIGRQRRMGKE